MIKWPLAPQPKSAGEMLQALLGVPWNQEANRIKESSNQNKTSYSPA